MSDVKPVRLDNANPSFQSALLDIARSLRDMGNSSSVAVQTYRDRMLEMQMHIPSDFIPFEPFRRSGGLVQSVNGFDPARIPGYLGIDPSLLYVDQQALEPKRVTAAQIHSELYAQVDTLLAEPEPMATTEPIATDRVKTLLDMGFTAQTDVAEFLTKRNRHASESINYARRKGQHELALLHAIRYPAYKFITLEGLQKVLLKYDLAYSGVDDFIGTIPEANVLEMARFHQQVTIHEEDEVPGAGYLIAAPADQFRQKQIVTTNWLLDDPIVLKQIKSGYLIVTAWGDEAKDPDVLNEKNN